MLPALSDRAKRVFISILMGLMGLCAYRYVFRNPSSKAHPQCVNRLPGNKLQFTLGHQSGTYKERRNFNIVDPAPGCPTKGFVQVNVTLWYE